VDRFRRLDGRVPVLAERGGGAGTDGVGGFEVLGQRGANIVAGAAELRLREAPDRMFQAAGQLLPIYLGLTLALWILLFAAGDSGFVALTHAMATISTSGLSPVGGPAASGAGFAGEVFIFLFLFTAISRRLYLDALIWRSPNGGCCPTARSSWR
jgi:hypothetical protein